MLGLIFSLSGCSFFIPTTSCPPPPLLNNPPLFSQNPPAFVPNRPDPLCPLNLCELISLALENSPTTRAVWFRAQAQAACVGEARGAYLPPIAFTAAWTKERFLIIDEPGYELPIFQTNSDITLSTAYLLFDFGGRNARLQMALAALSSMNWLYNWEVQTVMINVIQNYYNYVNALEVYNSDLLTVEDNKTTLEAALNLKTMGINTLADELQAQTALLQSQIFLQQHKGEMDIAFAMLAYSCGLPPQIPISIALLPDSFPLEMVCQDVELILQAASKNRADLAAMRSNICEKKAEIKCVRSAFFPTIGTNLIGGKGWINGCGPHDAYSINFSVNYPLFSSFADINAFRRAQANLEAAKADLENKELQAFLMVLTDYYAFRANTEILKCSEKYLEVAQENQAAAYANYLAGVTSILELMAANFSLNQARIQLATAKTDFLTSLASLSYNTGCLSPKAYEAICED